MLYCFSSDLSHREFQYGAPFHPATIAIRGASSRGNLDSPAPTSARYQKSLLSIWLNAKPPARAPLGLEARHLLHPPPLGLTAYLALNSIILSGVILFRLQIAISASQYRCISISSENSFTITLSCWYAPYKNGFGVSACKGNSCCACPLVPVVSSRILSSFEIA